MRTPRRRRTAPLRMARAPQEAQVPEIFPAAGCAWGTNYLSILLVKPCKDLLKFYSNVLVDVPREAFVFPFMSFSLYILGPSLSATPPPLRYVRVRAPQGGVGGCVRPQEVRSHEA